MAPTTLPAAQLVAQLADNAWRLKRCMEMEHKHPDHPIAVLVPELVEWRWYYYFLHNQRATALKVLLYAKGTGRIIVISMPSYMQS